MAVNLAGGQALPNIMPNVFNAGGNFLPGTKQYGTYRGLLSDWFNNEAIAYEDYMRSEQSAQADWERSMYQQRENNAFNAVEAQKDRDFQKMMSDTAYQRVVQDLRSAGLNPILAYQNGSASSPSGAMASAGGTSSRGRQSVSSPRANTGDFLRFVSGMLFLTGTALSKLNTPAQKSKHFGFGRKID